MGRSTGQNRRNRTHKQKIKKGLRKQLKRHKREARAAK